MLPSKNFLAGLQNSLAVSSNSRGSTSHLAPTEGVDLIPMPASSESSIEIIRAWYNPATDECCYKFKLKKPATLLANNVTLSANGAPLDLAPGLGYTQAYSKTADWTEWQFQAPDGLLCFKRGHKVNLTYLLGMQTNPSGGYSNVVVDSGYIILDCETDSCCKDVVLERENFTGPNGECCARITVDVTNASCIDRYYLGPESRLEYETNFGYISGREVLETCSLDDKLVLFGSETTDPEGKLARCDFKVKDIKHRKLKCGEFVVQYVAYPVGKDDPPSEEKYPGDRLSKKQEDAQGRSCFGTLIVQPLDKCMPNNTVFGYEIIEEYDNRIWYPWKGTLEGEKGTIRNKYLLDKPLTPGQANFFELLFDFKQDEKISESNRIEFRLLDKDGNPICNGTDEIRLKWDGRCWVPE